MNHTAISILLSAALFLVGKVYAASPYNNSVDSSRFRMDLQQTEIRNRRLESEHRQLIQNQQRWHEQKQIQQRLERAQKQINKRP
jgi:hypothetical protein